MAHLDHHKGLLCLGLLFTRVFLPLLDYHGEILVVAYSFIY